MKESVSVAKVTLYLQLSLIANWPAMGSAILRNDFLVKKVRHSFSYTRIKHGVG